MAEYVLGKKQSVVVPNTPTAVFLSGDMWEIEHAYLWIKNTHASVDFTSALIEVSPDGTSWATWDSTTFATLGHGVIKYLACLEVPYIRVTLGAGSTGSADIWISVNHH